MSDEFPDPEEEFELMHADEFDLLDEIENDYPPVSLTVTKAKRSLDFGKTVPVSSKVTTAKDSDEPSTHNETNPPVSPLLPMPKTPVGGESSKARTPFSEKNEQIRAEKNETTSKPEEKESPKITLINDAILETEDIETPKKERKNEFNKRTVDDLFGDIADIELEELLSGAKRIKTDVVLSQDEKQEMMIAKILAERKRQQVLKHRSFSNDLNDLTEKCKESVSMTRKVPKWPFFPITDKKGLRLYARLHSDDYIKRKSHSMAAATNSSINLSTCFLSTLDAAKRLLEQRWEKSDSKISTNSIKESKQKSIKEATTDLWVEKYKPKSYLQLLSDEGTNRIVLQWLKLWDKVVFNKERKIRKENKANKKENIFVPKNVPVLDEELDNNDCPKVKIALLCGPPGLGKTTLAHLLARHAGYNSVEVNASDDRSPELFQTKLETATQMQSVMGKERRPNCLVLDEIDGAPAASINFLIKFAAGKTAVKAKGKKKAEQKQVLRRPVICICNNIYAPALRPLRQAALVIHFPETSAARLAQRLVEIARKERISTDLSAMMALSQKTNNDIRSCLSTLYCYKDQPVKLSLIQRLDIGQKDMQKGFFSVWQDIFQITKPQPGSYSSAEKCSNSGASAGRTSDISFKNRMSNVLHSAQSCGDYGKLAEGVFENYLLMNLKDSFLTNVAEGLDWFCFFDNMSQVIYSLQAFVLLPYIPYCFVVWHFLFSSYANVKLTYPNTSYELSIKASKTGQSVDDLIKGTPAYIRAHLCKKPLQLDILPLLNVIINPNLRPVNVHLYSKREKEDFSKVVNTMIDYNLNFIQERAPDGNFVWRIDPDINEVVKFEGWQQDVFSLNSASKQLISREIEMEKVRRLETTASAKQCLQTPSTQSLQTPSRQKTESSTTPNTPKSGPVKIANHLQKLTPKAIAKTFANVPTKDFFGRVVKETEEECKKKKERKVDEIVKSEIWFHHKEGYNNAVRRPVTMRELM